MTDRFTIALILTSLSALSFWGWFDAIGSFFGG